MDILALIKDVAFPIFAAAYLLIEQTRKLDKLNLAITKLTIYVVVLMAEQDINMGDPLLASLVAQYLENVKDKKK